MLLVAGRLWRDMQGPTSSRFLLCVYSTVVFLRRICIWGDNLERLTRAQPAQTGKGTYKSTLFSQLPEQSHRKKVQDLVWLSAKVAATVDRRPNRHQNPPVKLKSSCFAQIKCSSSSWTNSRLTNFRSQNVWLSVFGVSVQKVSKGWKRLFLLSLCALNSATVRHGFSAACVRKSLQFFWGTVLNSRKIKVCKLEETDGQKTPKKTKIRGWASSPWRQI